MLRMVFLYMPLLIRTFYVKGQGIRVKKGVATKVKTLKGKKNTQFVITTHISI